MIEIRLSDIDKNISSREDIYTAISQKGIYSPGNVIDIIDSHEKVNFTKQTFTIQMTGFILWALQEKNENVANYLLKEYHSEILISNMLYTLIIKKVDPLFIMGVMDYWTVDSEGTSPIEVIKRVLSDPNEEYFEVFMDDKKILNSLTNKHIKKMFGTRISIKYLTKEIPLARWKKVLNEFPKINNSMSEVATDNPDILEIFYPNASDIFIF